MYEHRRIFTETDQKALSYVLELTNDGSEPTFITNKMMADHMGLRLGQQGSRSIQRLEMFGLIHVTWEKHPTSGLVQRVVHVSVSELPEWATRSSLVVIREVNHGM